MSIMAPMHVIIKTICRNYLAAGMIQEETVGNVKEVLAEFNDTELISVLLESHQMNPLNLEEHQVIFTSVN